ncbi:MAG: protein translocase subunit SecDF [Bacteroidetes bacterium]|nr:protein translocase subunit SecDF [Bacteroidota bacterium]
MQNKGAIRIFAILLGLACLFYLSFSWITRKVEGEASASAETYANKTEIVELAKKKANGNADVEKAFLDSVRGKAKAIFLDSVRKLPVDFPLYGSIFTYEDCKEHEINLGLDLKGGMNVTLEVSVPDIIRNMSAKPDDAKLNLALGKARVRETHEKKHFADIFAEELKKIDPGASLASYFRTIDMKGKIDFNTPDEAVIKLIKDRVDESIATSEKTLRARIDKFGVSQPNIQKLEASGRILIELPGVSDQDRVRKLLQGTANLEFWETFDNEEIIGKLVEADKRLAEILTGIKDTTASGDTTKVDSVKIAAKIDSAKTTAKTDTLKKDDTTSALSKLGLNNKDTAKNTAAQKATEDTSAMAKAKREHPLFFLLQPFIDQKGAAVPGPVVGRSLIKDTAKVMSYLLNEKIKRVLPDNVKFAWSFKPVKGAESVTQLIALKVTRRDKKPALFGDIMTDARKDYDQKGGGRPHISMTMTDEAAQTWAALTGDNIGKSVAIVLDDYVYSYPTVQGKISGGSSQITGDFTTREADDLVNILKAGKMPAPARIVEETVVGPTLGAESINAGFKSFAIALLLVFVFMAFYYGKGGMVADVVLLINTFFIIGVLASLGAVLTLPGIAGIVLVVAISVDANVLIFERIREELRGGKGLQMAVADGYKHAMSSILDSNVTTLLLGIILYAYGSGPVQGFATTLIIGILCSLFSALFISRLVFEGLLGRKRDVSFSIPLTANAFKNVNIDFVKRRKWYYAFSSLIILTGAIFYFNHGGFTMGVDFKGGRSYVVRFDNPVKTEEVGNAIRKTIGTKTGEQVKTFGGNNQVRITTAYMIDDTSSNAEEIVKQKLTTALDLIGNKYEIIQSQKVGETISRDLRNNAVWTILFSCGLMFVYILIRFKGWQYGLGATVALFHDVLVVLSCYAIFDGLLPFTLEINQDFIAAILTVMGYSMTDTVVVFDRIREYLNDKGKGALIPGEEKNRIINYALNTTLSRTMITSLITFFVLIAIFFFGGEVIRSFAFALLIGIVIGTYSSICIATPIVIDFDRRKKIAQ